MKFGIHSLLFSETFTERDLPLLDKAKAMGFDAMDIVPFDLERFPAKQVGQRAADLGLDIIIEIGMPAHANIISPDPEVRDAGVELTKRLIDASPKRAHTYSAESIMPAGGISPVACEPRKNGVGAWKTFVR